MNIHMFIAVSHSVTFIAFHPFLGGHKANITCEGDGRLVGSPPSPLSAGWLLVSESVKSIKSWLVGRQSESMLYRLLRWLASISAALLWLRLRSETLSPSLCCKLSEEAGILEPEAASFCGTLPGSFCELFWAAAQISAPPCSSCTSDFCEENEASSVLWLSDKTLLKGLLLLVLAGSEDGKVGVLWDLVNLKLDQLNREPGDELLAFWACGPLPADTAVFEFFCLLSEGFFSALKLNVCNTDTFLLDEADACCALLDADGTSWTAWGPAEVGGVLFNSDAVPPSHGEELVVSPVAMLTWLLPPAEEQLAILLEREPKYLKNSRQHLISHLSR